MIGIISQNIIRFILLITIQVLILNNIHLGGFVNPYIYIFFILLLPFETPGWLLIILGFFTGITVDLFSGTMGMHATATTLLAFSRPYVLKLFSPREGYEKHTQPTLRYYELFWIVRYSLLLILIHHFTLFFVEVFRFSGFFFTLLRIILSSMFTFVLIIISFHAFIKR
jgi:rod shape-determining protein MreD